MNLKQLLRRVEERGGISLVEIDSSSDLFLSDAKEGTLQRAFEVTPEEMEQLYAEGYRFYRQRQWEEAAMTFRFLVLFDPFVKKYWMGLAGAQQILGRHEKAVRHYTVASLLDDADPYPHFYASQCYTSLGHMEHAASALACAHLRGPIK